MEWLGPGLVAFAGGGGRASGTSSEALTRGGTELEPRPRLISSAGDLWLRPAQGARGAREPRDGEPTTRSILSCAVEEYFACGGRSCRVLDDLRFAGMPPSWVGEDGGAGHSSGIYSLAEAEDVETIVLCCDGNPERLAAVVDLAARRLDLLFILEGVREGLPEGGSGVSASSARRPAVLGATVGPVVGPVTGGGATSGAAGLAGGGVAVPTLTILERNVALLSRPMGSDCQGLGALVAFLEAVDFREEPEFRVASPEPPAWLSASQSIRLQAWRRYQGLRRSLDIGTRWVVFELNGPQLWRRVEREVTQFLRRLTDRGLIASSGGQALFDVRCGPIVPAPAGGQAHEIDGENAQALRAVAGETGVGISVSAWLSEPFGSALAEPLAGLVRTADRPSQPEEGGSTSGEESSQAEEGRSQAEEARSQAEEGRSQAEEGRSQAEDGRSSRSAGAGSFEAG